MWKTQPCHNLFEFVPLSFQFSSSFEFRASNFIPRGSTNILLLMKLLRPGVGARID